MKKAIHSAKPMKQVDCFYYLFATATLQYSYLINESVGTITPWIILLLTYVKNGMFSN
ncbi:hypothetical protein [Virgibacillus pantothenticus]|uniref:hypothetical protein n=1 Tax=Virgibacillus pantothenticus TaxID=1473 RepID=UPI001BB0BEA7|nr:hypothetical protein [Virgibacillus pantothenticus]